MTTLITIPNAKALHVPTKGTTPLPLAEGDLQLTIIPADPPTRPSEILSLSVEHATFPLLPSTPVHKSRANSQHPSYIFTPTPADGGLPIGQVLIQLRDSKSQAEWDVIETLSRQFEDVLKVKSVWEVVDEDDENDSLNLAGAKNEKGWGATIGEAIAGAGKVVADRLTTFTDRHIEAHPSQPEGFVPSLSTAKNAASANQSTASFAATATSIAHTVGQKVHDGGVAVGEFAKGYLPEAATTGEKSEVRKGVEEQWEQVTLAAAGTTQGVKAVGQSVSDNSHRAIEHDGGPHAEAFAQDVGQTGANIGTAALAATEATSVVVQGGSAGSGASKAV